MSMDALYNAHKGQIGLVIGNGPSLNKTPKKLLRKYASFGSNRIYLMPKFTPTYYVAVNPLVVEQYADDIDSIECKAKFICRSKSDLIHNCYPLKSIGSRLFSFAPGEYIYEGYTVTFVSLQLAYWMGFSTVLLVGVDHSYKFDGRPNQPLKAVGADPNHFDPTYFSGGKTWNAPDLERSEQAYWMAKAAYENNGRRIINLTPGSMLDVFEKGELKEW